MNMMVEFTNADKATLVEVSTDVRWIKETIRSMDAKLDEVGKVDTRVVLLEQTNADKAMRQTRLVTIWVGVAAIIGAVTSFMLSHILH